MSKTKIIKAYDAIGDELKIKLRLEYPYGFDKRLISFKNAKGKLITALPYETEDRQYLIKMTSAMAAAIVSSELKLSSTTEDDEELDGIVMDVVEDEDRELDEKLEKEVAKEAAESL